MVPPETLSPKVMAALGLLGCTTSTACLDVQACLDYPLPTDTGDTGDTSDDAGDAASAIDSVRARGGLPADVEARLKKS